MNCPKCSFFNKEEETVCQKCKKKIRTSEEALKRKKITFFTIGGMIMVIAVALTLFLFLRDEPTPETPFLVTTIRNYDFEMTFNMTIDAGLYAARRIEVTAEGRFDHINRKKHYHQNSRWFINTPDQMIEQAEVYVDFTSIITYIHSSTNPRWISHRIATPLINLNDFIEAMEDGDEVTRMGSHEYRLAITNLRVLQLAHQFAGGIANYIQLSEEGNEFVTLEIRDGLILSARYDFSSLFSDFNITNFVITINFTNHNQTDPVLIPDSVINNSTPIEVIEENARMCLQARNCEFQPNNPQGRCTYSSRGQEFYIYCPNPAFN